jgi:hypothetical protein
MKIAAAKRRLVAVRLRRLRRPGSVPDGDSRLSVPVLMAQA